MSEKSDPEGFERGVCQLLSFAPHRHAYVRQWIDAFGGLVAALVATPALTRLRGVSQLGLKRGTVGVSRSMVPLCDGDISATTELRSFSRLAHSVRVAETMLAFCALHDVPLEEARDSVVASLLHDVGHTAFSHTLERVLHRHGHPDHEAIGQNLVRVDPDLVRAFARFGVDVRRIVSVMREEDDLGLRQKVVDTCAYLLHDGVLMGLPLPAAFVADLLRSVAGVQDGALVVHDASAALALLDRRAWFAAETYEHPYNRVNTLLLAEAADWLVREGRLPMETVVRGRDGDVIDAFDRAVREGAPTWLSSARRFLRGDAGTLARWKTSAHTLEAEAHDVAAASSLDAPAFFLPPIDCTAKTLRIRLPDGTVRSVRASSGLRPPHHVRSHVVSYIGPT